MKKIKEWLQENKEEKEQKLFVTNPYLNARRAWNTHTAGLMKSLQLWQLIGVSSLLISITAVGGLISVGSQSKFVPLVFQQDASGNTLSVTKADKVTTANIDDYRAAAAHFIENLRLVSIDSELQKKAVFQVYSYLNNSDSALTKVQEVYKGKNNLNPFERAATELVNVEIRSVLQESESTWQVDWIETFRNRDGTMKTEPVVMKSLLTMYQNDDVNDVSSASILKNPHLIYVRDFNISYDLKNGANS